ncbi:MAG: type II toxin-antitoxin system VapC family toxin [candidate division NC10 bacterium]|nr:type II toxin-antitoxin system VapC family toxin [candidate division NC10 bacterium]
MTLSEIPSATEIFIDANIFVYHFSGPTALTPACSAFLRRIEDRDLAGFTSLIVVAEVLHRLMIIEATETLQVEARQVVRYLKEHPTEVRKLTGHLVVPEKIQAIGVHILTPTFDDLLASQEEKLTFGFLTNDAMNLAVMKRHHLTHIATNDPDFARVESLKVWSPSPLSPSA